MEDRIGYDTPLAGSGMALSGHCPECGERFFPPRPRCPRCKGTAVQVVPLAETGVVLYQTTVQVTVSPFAERAPYVVAVAKLADGIQIIGRLAAADRVERGQAVRARCLKTMAGGFDLVLTPI